MVGDIHMILMYVMQYIAESNDQLLQPVWKWPENSCIAKYTFNLLVYDA